MHFEWKLKLRTHDASYYQIQMVNKEDLTIVAMYFQVVEEINQQLQKLTEEVRNLKATETNLTKGNKLDCSCSKIKIFI